METGGAGIVVVTSSSFSLSWLSLSSSSPSASSSSSSSSSWSWSQPCRSFTLHGDGLTAVGRALRAPKLRRDPESQEGPKAQGPPAS
eukprot:7390442-Pyramimonas_sp.AAC.1